MTVIRHHPADDLLLQLAAGHLPAGPALVVSSHVEGCAACSERLRMLDAVGGCLLQEVTPVSVRDNALARTWAAIDAPAPRPAAASWQGLPPLPAGAVWPRSMAGSSATRWRWIGPGMYFSRVQPARDPAANVFLLRIGAGKYLPLHTHSGIEWTQVLHGSFHDGRAQFAAGDFDAADGGIRHQPVVQAGGECICLAAVDGKVLFDGVIARTFGAMMGM